MATKLQFSARLLNIPAICCNCCSASANMKWESSHARVTGKRVIKTNTKSWTFKICSHCMDWIDAKEELPAKRRRAHAAASMYLWLGFGAVSAILCGSGFAAMGTMMFNAAGVCTVVLGIPLLLLGLVGAAYIPGSWKKGQRALDKFDAFQSRVKKMRPGNAASTRPVGFLGWNGSVLTFAFENDDYAEAFRNSNRAKWLRS